MTKTNSKTPKVQVNQVFHLNLVREITVMEGEGWGMRFVRVDNISGDYCLIRKGSRYHLFNNDRGIDLFMKKDRFMTALEGSEVRTTSEEQH